MHGVIKRYSVIIVLFIISNKMFYSIGYVEPDTSLMLGLGLGHPKELIRGL